MILANLHDKTAARLLLYLGVILLLIGVVSQQMWLVLPRERFVLSLLLALVAAGLAWPCHRFMRWSWASSLALVWSLALLALVGPMQVLGALALGAAALAIGLACLRVYIPARLALATTLGLAVIAGIGGWLLTLPIHQTWCWWALVLGLVIWRRTVLQKVLVTALHGWRTAVAESPLWAALAISLLGLASTACWLPSMQFDDLAYHLGLPSQLLMFGEYRPDPVHQVWSFAPWAGDALQGFAAVLAGEHARGTVNAMWLGLTAATIWSASKSMGARSSERWATVALFASLPPLVWMAAGMQTELPATAVLATLLAVIVAPTTENTGHARLLVGAILLGAVFALKGIHVLSALPLLCFAGWHHRHALPWRHLPWAVLLVLVIGGSSYWQSWSQTGNPVLPLFNTYFQSPYFPVDNNYRDPRWFTGFSPWLPWQVVFNTDRYVEAWDGGIGLSLIGLSGTCFVALFQRRTWAISLALALAFLLPLVPMQYVRYAYPGLLLLVLAQVPFAIERFGVRHFRWMLVGACVLNLAFQANAGWTQHSSALKRVLRSGGDPAAVYPHYVPERMLLQQIPADDHGLVLASNPRRSYIAELGGRGRLMLDHDPQLHAARMRAETDASGAAWASLFAKHHIRWILLTPASASPALKTGLAQSAHRVAAIGDAELWQVDGTIHTL